ncbi:MAG: NTP transferase domain-containing protein [Solirubrobacteraceae bacterium]
MRTAAILPVKRFPEAKKRLGESVEDSLRAELAKAMVGDVLSALRACEAIEATIVVTCEPVVAHAAGYIGAIVVEDTADAGQSAAAMLGLAKAMDEGFERALCVPGDCPTLDPSELRELLDDPLADGALGEEDKSLAESVSGEKDERLAEGGSGEEAESRLKTHPPRARGTLRRELTIVPDRHGTGTNGLLLAPPNAIEPSFGPDSRARHELAAHAGVVVCRIAQPASLLLDIDTGADLAVLRERLADTQMGAPRTRAVLARASETTTGQADPDRSSEAA